MVPELLSLIILHEWIYDVHVCIQAIELLEHAFEISKGKDYCVVTLPHDSAEPALMASMTRLSPLPGTSFPEVGKYEYHRTFLIITQLGLTLTPD